MDSYCSDSTTSWLDVGVSWAATSQRLGLQSFRNFKPFYWFRLCIWVDTSRFACLVFKCFTLFDVSMFISVGLLIIIRMTPKLFDLFRNTLPIGKTIQRIESSAEHREEIDRLTSTLVAQWSWAAIWRPEQTAGSSGVATAALCHLPPSRRLTTNWSWPTFNRVTLAATSAKCLDAKELRLNTSFWMSKASRPSTGYGGPGPNTRKP